MHPRITKNIQQKFEATDKDGYVPDICGIRGRACRRMNDPDGACSMLCTCCALREFAKSKAEYILDHITQENGKWYAEIKKQDGSRENTGDLWGWEGMTYPALQAMLAEYYCIKIPAIKELNLIKRTQNRKIYSITKMSLEDALAYFQRNEVKCEIVRDDRPQYGDFIAVFGYGKLTRCDIAKVIKSNNLLCMFFESAIREDEYKKKHGVNAASE